VTRERIRQIQEEALRKMRAGMEERDRPVTDETVTFAVAA
jgi:DNA-directed RNA polymerase sigma subunit (sigma70/sigma32)